MQVDVVDGDRIIGAAAVSFVRADNVTCPLSSAGENSMASEVSAIGSAAVRLSTEDHLSDNDVQNENDDKHNSDQNRAVGKGVAETA